MHNTYVRAARKKLKFQEAELTFIFHAVVVSRFKLMTISRKLFRKRCISIYTYMFYINIFCKKKSKSHKRDFLTFFCV
jgi:hypothetical protein